MRDALVDLLVFALGIWMIVAAWPSVWAFILIALLALLAVCQCAIWILGWMIKSLDEIARNPE